ncbi:MAG TPA: hypothetical protein VNR66_07690 [Solirubrobacteraceae bacterium]|nr:hypothetical protein [Solirubrobacteraceae bacterium]
MRRTYLITIAVGVLLFLFVSAVLARVWSADGAETDAVTALVQAEARGDETAVVDRLQGCRASVACRTQVAAYVAELRRAGGVSILQMQLSTGFTLSGHLGSARVAWRSPTSLPIVQCVRVRRAGNAFSGLHIELLALSPRITSDADCPARF